jgi:hypothetical protein
MKNQWIDNLETTERTLAAMAFNIRCKEEMLNKIIAHNQELEEEIKGLKLKLTHFEKGGKNDSNGISQENT